MKRTEAQNRFMWPMCQQIADQLNAVNAEYLAHSPNDTLNKLDIKQALVREFGKDEIVHIPSAAMMFVRAGRTSQFSDTLFSEFLTFSLAWADMNGLSVMMPPDYEEWSRAA